MLQNQKCSTYYTPWKYYIDTIEANDIVFLYSSGTGIIARGIATGIIEIDDYEGKENEEHFMNLDRFEILRDPLPASCVTSKIREIAGDDFGIQWNQTMILLAENFGRKVWQHISKNCI